MWASELNTSVEGTLSNIWLFPQINLTGNYCEYSKECIMFYSGKSSRRRTLPVTLRFLYTEHKIDHLDHF